MNSLTTETLIIFLLVLTNGFFSLSEMAIVSARKVRVQQRAKEGSQAAFHSLKSQAQSLSIDGKILILGNSDRLTRLQRNAGLEPVGPPSETT
jgi:CBS domain containing-hemolysin-like protein